MEEKPYSESITQKENSRIQAGYENDTGDMSSARRIYIVTGTTRGLGRAIAEAVVESGDFLLSLSSAPDRFANANHNVQCDLSRSDTIAENLGRLMKSVNIDNAREIILINNAGVLEPMGFLDSVEHAQVLYHLLVNQAAPAILMSTFIRLTGQFEGPRRIINISSGAGIHPYAGWAMYCASKAALNMMTRCAAAEQQFMNNGVAIYAVSPGKVETDMQVKIRSANPQRFPRQHDFIEAKRSGQLLSPEIAARKILDLDKHGDFQNGGLYDLRGPL